jgi:hypothetical protein
MGVHVGRNGGVDRIQEAPKLDGAMGTARSLSRWQY